MFSFTPGIRSSQFSGTRIKSYAPTRVDGEPGMKCSSISAMTTYCDKSHEELKWEDYQLKIQGTITSVPISMLPNTSSTLLTSNPPSKSSPSSSFIFPKISNISGFGSSFSQSNATATSSPFPSATTLSSVSSSFSGCAYSNRTANSPLSMGVIFNTGTKSSLFTDKPSPQLVFSSLTSSATTNSSLIPGFSSWSSTSQSTTGAFINQSTLNCAPAQSFPSPFQPSPSSFSSTGSVLGSTSSTTPSPRTPSIIANLHPSDNHAANSSSGSSVLLNIDPSFSRWQAHSGQTVATSTAEAYIQVPANGRGLFNIASNQFPASNNCPLNSAPLFSTTDASTVDIVSVKDPFGVLKGGSHSLSVHATSVPSCPIGISNMAVRTLSQNFFKY